MPDSYLVSSVSEQQLAEFHRLMNEEVKDVAIFFMDPHGIIKTWNRAAEEMKGFTAKDAIGSHLRLLYTPQDAERGWPEHNLGEARKNGFYREETWRQRKDGGVFWARVALTALHDDTGELIGFSKVTVDLTDHKMLERCIKEREQIKRVLNAANAGTWTWHPEKDEIEVSENLLALLGQPGGEKTMKLDDWISFVHPEDRAAVRERFRKARLQSPREHVAMNVRMCPKHARCRWFYMHADWYRERDDSPFELSGVNVDIQELKSTESELRNAYDKLKEADARKDEFLAMLAHELRNPLAPIRSAAEVLRTVKLDDARMRQTSEVIARQADHMTSLVDDLLDVSRVTRGLVELEKHPVDVRHIVNDAVEQVNPIIRQRRHHLSLQLSPDACVVLGDRKRLVQVIANLLNNSAKFTQEGGNILVRMQVEESQVVLTVNDDGIGMEPELAERVFELFAQAERTPDRASGGLGLGLALVKSLVELQGGTVKCTSEGLGQGSTFTVWLPLAHADTKGEWPETEEPAGQQRGKGLRVLVVDDNVDAAEMLAMLLQQTGHDVWVENESWRALERSRRVPPDVFLLDIGLPEIDGNELARRLKAQPETAEAVLIAVTGYGQEHDRARALASGFSHHFVKPVDPAELTSLLARISQRQSDKGSGRQ